MKSKGISAAIASALCVLGMGVFTGSAAATPPVIEETYDFVTGDDWDRYGEWGQAMNPDPSDFLFAAMQNDVEPELCPFDECGLLVGAFGPASFSAGDAGVYYLASPGGEAAYIKAAQVDKWAYYKNDPLEGDDPQGLFTLLDSEGEIDAGAEYFTDAAWNEPALNFAGDEDSKIFAFGLTAEASGSIVESRGAYLGKVKFEYGDSDDPVLSTFSSAKSGLWVGEQPFDASVAASDQGLGLTQVQVTAPLTPPDHYESAWGQICHGTHESPCPDETPAGAKVTIDPSELPGGPNTLTAKAWDVYDQQSDPMQMSIKVDKTKPSIDLGGSFMSAPGMVLDGPSYDLDVDATDGTVGNPNSGVVDLKVKIDNVLVDSDSQACATQNCALELHPTIDPSEYTNGPHQLKVQAKDAVGHIRTTTVDFEIDDSSRTVVEETYDFVTGAGWDGYGDWSQWPPSPSDFLFAAMQNDVEPELCPFDDCGLIVAAEGSVSFEAGDMGIYYVNPPGYQDAYIDSVDVDKWAYYKGTDPLDPDDPRAVFGTISSEDGFDDDAVYVTDPTFNGSPMTFRGGRDTGAFGFGLVSEENSTPTDIHAAYLGKVTLRYGDRQDPELTEFSSVHEDQWVGEQPFDASIEASDTGLGLSQVRVSAPLTPPDEYGSAWEANCEGTHASRCPEYTPTGAKVTVDPSELPEGTNTLTATAWDITDRTSDPLEMDIKVDKTKPGIDLGGTFMTAPGMVLDGPTYGLEVEATDGTVGDPNSGVVDLKVKIDNVLVDSDSQACATQNCTLGLDPTIDPDNYSNGSHQLRVEATDAVGHVRTTTVDFTVDR